MLKKNYYFFEGILYVLLCYLSWSFSTIVHRNEVWGIIGLACWIVTQLIYVLFVSTTVKYCDVIIISQIQTVNNICIIIYAYMVIMIFNEWNLFHFISMVLGLTATVICKRIAKKNKDNHSLIPQILNVVKQHVSLVILIFIVGLLSVDWNGIQFKWDGLLYYKACCNLTIFSISNLAIYGHIAQSFGLLIGLLSYLFSDVADAMFISNIALLIISTCSFYGIVQTLVPNKKEWQYTIATTPYALSPFLLGMVNYYNLDFFCMCGFTIFLYFTLKKEWIYQLIAALFFCFTKEPAIITYGFFCSGLVIIDLFINEEKSIKDRLQKLLRTKQYYLMIIPGILWLVTFKFIGPWSAGAGGVELDKAYAIEKCKVLYLLNFNWIYTLFMISGIIYIFIKRKNASVNWKWLFPLLLSQLAFTVFSCIFKTVNHPRYSDTSVVSLCLIGVLVVFIFLEDKIAMAMFSLIAILMIVSCYFTIDSISMLCLPTFNVGNSTMISTLDESIGDGMIYNKQALDLEKVMSLALDDALKQGDTVIFPVFGNSTYYFDGMAEVKRVENYDIQTEYWNIKKARRVPFISDDTIRFRVYNIKDNIIYLTQLMEFEKNTVSLILIPNMDMSITKEIDESYNIIDEQEYVYRGWRMKRISFKNK